MEAGVWLEPHLRLHRGIAFAQREVLGIAGILQNAVQIEVTDNNSERT